MLDFLVIGSQKCGTTWLFNTLKMHPRLYFPMGKEAHHWNDKFYRGDAYRRIYRQSMRGPVVDMCNYVCGEATPAYCIMPVEKIQQLHKLHPDIKIFLMVRNPVLRAWSALKMTYRYRNLDVSNLTDEKIFHAITNGDTKRMGCYDEILKNWLTVFDSSLITVIFFDDILTRYRQVLEHICQKLKIETDFYNHIPNTILSKASLKGSRELMSQKVYKNSLDCYQQSILFLENYTSRNLEHWNNYESYKANSSSNFNR